MCRSNKNVCIFVLYILNTYANTFYILKLYHFKYFILIYVIQVF